MKFKCMSEELSNQRDWNLYNSLSKDEQALTDEPDSDDDEGEYEK